jgi:hypothetical protein
VTDSDNETKQQVVGALREVRDKARTEARPDHEPPSELKPEASAQQLDPMTEPAKPEMPVSPDRSLLNERWDVSTALVSPPQGKLGRLFSPLRGPLQRMLRFALGPFIESQVELNSAQVKFGNEFVGYVDKRMDHLSAHYGGILGLHGKRIDEIDERHLILQQELIQHVHDLVKRIDYVFETAEQNHLYLEGFLREIREELVELGNRVSNATSSNEARDASSEDRT